MALDIHFPSTTEIYRALMGKTGPYAYVPKLYKAIQKLYDHPCQKNLDAAKKITTNPTIHKLLDAINKSNADGWRNSEDTIMDIQYGIIATLIPNEYTQLPWLVDEIKDDKLKYNVLSFYETKYTNPEYIKKYDAQPINKNTHDDYLAKCIIEIELAKLSNSTTSDAETRTILGNINQMMTLPRFKRQKNTLLSSVFDILQKRIDQELARPTPSETKIDSVYCLYAHEFANLFDDKNYAFIMQQKFNSSHIMSAHKQKSATPQKPADTYDKIKAGAKRIKKQIHDATNTPHAQEIKNQATTTLDNAARTTINAIDSGIKKLKQTATRENFNAATASIKKQWNEFKKNLDNLFDQIKDM